MPLTQPVYDRLRLVFSIRTGVSLAAACYGYFLGVHAPRQLANALSVGLAVGAVALAVAFALSATTNVRNEHARGYPAALWDIPQTSLTRPPGMVRFRAVRCC